jgi:hypothetical protein
MTFEEIQKIFPWVVSLPTLPKVVLSALIAGIVLFLLLLIWAPSPPDPAVERILTGCYR